MPLLTTKKESKAQYWQPTKQDSPQKPSPYYKATDAKHVRGSAPVPTPSSGHHTLLLHPSTLCTG